MLRFTELKMPYDIVVREGNEQYVIGLPCPALTIKQEMGVEHRYMIKDKDGDIYYVYNAIDEGEWVLEIQKFDSMLVKFDIEHPFTDAYIANRLTESELKTYRDNEPPKVEDCLLLSDAVAQIKKWCAYEASKKR